MSFIKPNYSNIFLFLFLFLFLFFAIALYFHSLFYANLNGDGGFYLGVSNQIANGSTLYKEIPVFYTPFTFYYFSIFIYLFGKNLIVLFLSIYVILFLSAGLIYFISVHFTKDRKFSALLSIVYLIASYYYDGSYIYIEAFVNLFGLSAIYSLLLWRSDKKVYLLFLAGLFVSLSFLSKQFGVAYSFLCGMYIVVYSQSFKNAFKSLGILILGFLIPILLLLLIYFSIKVSPTDLIGFIFRKSYATKSWSMYINALLNYLYINCFVFLLTPFLLFKFKSYNLQRLITLIILIVFLFSFTIIYYIRDYLHYSLLLLPVTFVIVSVVYSIIVMDNLYFSKITFSILFCLSILLYTKRAIQRYIGNERDWDRIAQLSNAVKINKVIPPKSVILTFDFPEYYFLCDFNPDFQFGYPWINDMISQDRNDVLKNTRYFVLHKTFLEDNLKEHSEFIKGETINIKDSNIVIVKTR